MLGVKENARKRYGCQWGIAYTYTFCMNIRPMMGSWVWSE